MIEFWVEQDCEEYCPTHYSHTEVSEVISEILSHQEIGGANYE